MLQYKVRCPHCNRISSTSKNKFQCRQPSGCGKRSLTEFSLVTKYDELIDYNQNVPADQPNNPPELDLSCNNDNFQAKIIN